MKKRLFGLLCTIILCLSLSVPVFAEGEMPLLVDNADLLDEEEESELLVKLQEISADKQMDVVVVTENEIGGATPMEYADDFYDYNGYADDGVLLLVSMAERDWYISTKGYGITAFTDAGIQYIGEEIISDLGDGYYADAFQAYADLCADFIDQARTGAPYDVDHLPEPPYSFFGTLVIALVVGFIISLIATGIMRLQLKSVFSRSEAAEYVKKGSMKVTRSSDLFLYRHIDRRARPKESSSGSSSGGSSTHVSSSGSTHGGGGGKF